MALSVFSVPRHQGAHQLAETIIITIIIIIIIIIMKNAVSVGTF